MGIIRVRRETGNLYLDFFWAGKRFREQSRLKDDPANREELKRLMKAVDKAMKEGTFVYADWFGPGISFGRMSRAELKKHVMNIRGRSSREVDGNIVRVLFSDFAKEFLVENEIQWKRSYRKTIRGTLDSYLIPAFGNQLVSQIKKGDILKFRATLARSGVRGKPLSNDRINHILTPMRMIMEEVSERFGVPNPMVRYKPLPISRDPVEPFSLDEVHRFLRGVREDFRNYYTVRFFSAMRTGEIDGLQWQYVDFDRREILIQKTIVDGKEETPKNNGSVRSIHMSTPVYGALKLQWEKTGHLDGFVFCNQVGGPLCHGNVTKRVWYPTLDKLGLKRRTPYQTRHTAATLWLAAGENPEWIARQMGHTNTRMLFTVYSRFVPNLTRSDGSAFEGMLAQKGFLKESAYSD